MNARYYDPLIGSFTTADTYIDGEDSFMGFNRYAYVHGNPIKYNDPTGHFIGWLIGVAKAVGKLLISVVAGCASDRGCRSAVEDEVNSWFDTPQPEDDYDGYDAGSDGGFYGEPNSEGFPGDSNSFGPTIPSAYIDTVQEMIYQDYQRYQNNREFDGIQRTLDAASLVPVFGIAADLVNAGISAARGRWKDAAMSLGAAVPGVGIAAGLYRLGKGGLKGAKWLRPSEKVISKSNKFFSQSKSGSFQTITKQSKFWELSTRLSGRKSGYTIWRKTLNSDGKTIRLLHDTYDNHGRFLHRSFKVPEPLRHIR